MADRPWWVKTASPKQPASATRANNIEDAIDLTSDNEEDGTPHTVSPSGQTDYLAIVKSTTPKGSALWIPTYKVKVRNTLRNKFEVYYNRVQSMHENCLYANRPRTTCKRLAVGIWSLTWRVAYGTCKLLVFVAAA